MSKRVKTSISLPKNLLKRLDKYAKSMKMDRSHFIEWLLESSLELMPSANQFLTDYLKKIAQAQGLKQKEEGEAT